jgi:predicted Zn-ribbon and HTH transcriptional regulator
MLTLDEKIALINKKRQDNPQARIDRKAARVQRRLDYDAQKHSHDWECVWSPHSRGSGHNQPTRCKRCGIEFMQFKIFPAACKSE